MSAYSPPILNNGSLNTVFNSNNFNSGVTSLTQNSADNRYLKLSGGTISSNLTVNNNLTAQTISTPTTYNAYTNSANIGYIVTTGSFTNSVSTATNSVSNVANITLSSQGVWLITANVAFSGVSVGQLANLTISPTSNTSNNACQSYVYNMSAGTAYYYMSNLSFVYANSTTNKTIYLCAGTSSSLTLNMYNQTFSAVRLA